MSKTKKAERTAVTTTDESQSYKRQRMLEVRQMVAKAVKNNTRVDLMGFTGTDIARSQIALQDLLSKEQEKHAKAGDHIVSLKTDLEIFNTGLNVMIAHLKAIIEGQSEQLKVQDQKIYTLESNCNELAMILDSTMRSQHKTETTNLALKTTLKELIHD